ncbi:MAG: malate synthase A, partial [Alphaproteobacteria bacterium]|nr:malate synthase A [Alphaproteobacteria bacterium]
MAKTAVTKLPKGVKILAPISPAFAEILTPDAVAFVGALERKFGKRRLALLKARAARQKRIDKGEDPTFLSATRAVREGDWLVAPLPRDILDRRVEITGPVERKMIIN